ncbi:piggyBac transposable element-derived protein 4-like [Centruroides sculpturatus]|uniref:piggyBac transposable element-derived protein 4-like n=1 Tax=Centruroides sculpturatus TaxID=218467 RepID=UPI000C6CDE80|nr:piggyBac transposable element-derived protein 4-like [Centruroides sculpturatus]XP_023238135.1 piggyBac transposable element-derived protein 4-like [Centruroides sculpturatus]
MNIQQRKNNRSFSKQAQKRRKTYDSDETNSDLSSESENYIKDKYYDYNDDYDSDESEELQRTEKEENDIRWNDVSNTKRANIQFDKQPKINILISSRLTPIDYFRLFLTDNVLNYIVEKTNKHAEHIISKVQFSQMSRMSAWKPTCKEEMETFFGLLLWMDLVKFPGIDNYWSRSAIYKNEVINAMKRNRFELLLKIWYFSNDDDEPENDFGYKMRYFFHMLVQQFKEIRIPGSIMIVDTITIPCKGYLHISQCISKKQKRYGIKIFKLCSSDGYTYNMLLYDNKLKNNLKRNNEHIVLKLCDNYLQEERVLFANSFFTSVTLAHDLLKRKTHLLGTLQSSNKDLPQKVIHSQLTQGQIVGMIDNEGVLIAKWKNKKEAVFLSTYHNLDFIKTERKNKEIKKPKLTVDYKAGRAGINKMDQMSHYSSPMRKTLCWYHRVAMETLFGVCVVNAFIIYKQNNVHSTMTIRQFREQLVKSLLHFNDSEGGDENENMKFSLKTEIKHKLEVTKLKSIRNKKIRRYCIHCIEKSLKKHGIPNVIPSKKVTTFCSVCPSKPFVCVNCFSYHMKRGPILSKAHLASYTNRLRLVSAKQ